MEKADNIVKSPGHRAGSLSAPFEPTREAREADTFAVIRLSLRGNAYDWEFVPQAGGTFTESGTTTCH